MSKNLDDVFEIPKTEPKEKKCCSKKPIPQKADPEFEQEVNNYLDEVKRTVSEKKPPRKNNITEEGRKQMLANLKKGRETRKMNLNKAHEMRQNELKAEIDEMKTLLKSSLGEKKVEAEPKVLKVETPEVKQVQTVQVVPEPNMQSISSTKRDAFPEVKVVPIVIQHPAKQLIVKSTYKKPLW